jgi:hypothetical protein
MRPRHKHFITKFYATVASIFAVIMVSARSKVEMIDIFSWSGRPPKSKKGSNP